MVTRNIKRLIGRGSAIGAAVVASALSGLAHAQTTLPTFNTTQTENYIKTEVTAAIVAVGGAVFIAVLVFMLFKWIKKMLK